MSFEHSSAHDLIDAPDLAMDFSSGRATWDERGNSIWEWQTAPGVYSRDISAQQMQALAAAHLHLMDGGPIDAQPSLWSRNARTRFSAYSHEAEMILPRRKVGRVKSNGFDMFLRKLLPA